MRVKRAKCGRSARNTPQFLRNCCSYRLQILHRCTPNVGHPSLETRSRAREAPQHYRWRSAHRRRIVYVGVTATVFPLAVDVGDSGSSANLTPGIKKTVSSDRRRIVCACHSNSISSSGSLAWSHENFWARRARKFFLPICLCARLPLEVPGG